MVMRGLWIQNPNKDTPGEPALVQRWIDVTDLEALPVRTNTV
jgi:hypothetical protein